MTSRFPSALLAVAVLCAGAATVSIAGTVGSGTLVSETRAISGFSAVAMRGGIDVILRQGDREAVQVRADDNILPLVQTDVEGDGDNRTLRIQLKPGESVQSRHRIEVTVDVVRLSTISTAGSGDVEYGGIAVLTRRRIAGSGSIRQSP
jgi:hypothetical protein